MDTRVYRAFEQQVEMGKKGLKVLEDWENMTAEQKAELYPHASDYAAMVDRVAKSKQYCSDCIEVRRRSLIQAKLFANKAVSRVPDVNAAVVTWAKQCGISYNTTSDVREVTS